MFVGNCVVREKTVSIATYHLGIGDFYKSLILVFLIYIKETYLYFVTKTKKVIIVLKFVISMLNNTVGKSDTEKIKTLLYQSQSSPHFILKIICFLLSITVDLTQSLRPQYVCSFYWFFPARVLINM